MQQVEILHHQILLLESCGSWIRRCGHRGIIGGNVRQQVRLELRLADPTEESKVIANALISQPLGGEPHVVEEILVGKGITSGSTRLSDRHAESRRLILKQVLGAGRQNATKLGIDVSESSTSGSS